MTLSLRIVLVLVSMITAGYVLFKIRKSQMHIEDSISWIFTSILLVVVSIFPGVATFASRLLGVVSPANFVFLCIIFVLLIQVFSLSAKLSKLNNKFQKLVQSIALERHEEDSCIKRSIMKP